MRLAFSLTARKITVGLVLGAEREAAAEIPSYVPASWEAAESERSDYLDSHPSRWQPEPQMLVLMCLTCDAVLAKDVRLEDLGGDELDSIAQAHLDLSTELLSEGSRCPAPDLMILQVDRDADNA